LKRNWGVLAIVMVACSVASVSHADTVGERIEICDRDKPNQTPTPIPATCQARVWQQGAGFGFVAEVTTPNQGRDLATAGDRAWLRLTAERDLPAPGTRLVDVVVHVDMGEFESAVSEQDREGEALARSTSAAAGLGVALQARDASGAWISVAWTGIGLGPDDVDRSFRARLPSAEAPIRVLWSVGAQASVLSEDWVVTPGPPRRIAISRTLGLCWPLPVCVPSVVLPVPIDIELPIPEQVHAMYLSPVRGAARVAGSGDVHVEVIPA
jgi:hypothetical protein